MFKINSGTSFQRDKFICKRRMTNYKGDIVMEDFNMWVEDRNNRKIYLPRYRGSEEFGRLGFRSIPDLEVENEKVEFKGTLRNYQQECFEKSSEKGFNGVVCMPCGFGKTALAIYIAVHLMRKKGGQTVIVVHTSWLAKQWSDAIRAFCPGAIVEDISRCKQPDKDAMFMTVTLQSLTRKDNISAYRKMLSGTTLAIFDEVHHIAATTFINCLVYGIVDSPYRIGLSATPERTDNMTDVINAHLGPIIFKVDRNSKEILNVEFHTVSYVDPVVIRGKLSYVETLTNICSDKLRLSDTSRILRDLWYRVREKERNCVIVLSQRKELLKYLHKNLMDLEEGERPGPRELGFYMGGIHQSELDSTLENAKIMFMTVSMAAEGLDCPRADTIMFATPPSANVEQCVGRAMRKKHEKGTLVVDLIDPCLKYKTNSRKRSYRALGWKDFDEEDTVDFV